jgi:hypothetical protein
MSSLIRSRKGFTYLLVSSLIVVVLLATFFASSTYKYQDKESLEQVRIRAMNDFIKNLNEDIHRATYISAFRSMIALEGHVVTTGHFLTDINSSFRETFFYGTINNTNSSIMENSSFSSYLSRVQELAAQTGITLDVNVTKIQIMQSNPWEIDVLVFMDILASDNRRTAYWNMSKEYATHIPIANLRDPLYSRGILNPLPNVVKHLDTTQFVNGTNVSILQTHIDGSYYVASTYAPSFIMRFEGNFDPDPNGIESIVSNSTVTSMDPNKIKIDYIYFGYDSTSYTKVCNVQNVASGSNFVIPINRVELYKISGLTYLNGTDCP